MEKEKYEIPEMKRQYKIKPSTNRWMKDALHLTDYLATYCDSKYPNVDFVFETRFKEINIPRYRYKVTVKAEEKTEN